jgi:hypothetical protein
MAHRKMELELKYSHLTTGVEEEIILRVKLDCPRGFCTDTRTAYLHRTLCRSTMNVLIKRGCATGNLPVVSGNFFDR